MLTRRVIILPGLLFVATALSAQSTTTSLVPPHDSLLPPSFGAWTTTHPASPAPEPSISLVNANKAALGEDNPQRSEVVDYAGPGGRVFHVEAVQFADYTGAWSAFTLLRTAGLKDAKDLGTNDAVGANVVLFTSGATLVVVGGATAADIPSLKPLAGSLPLVHGSQAQPPLIPLFLPDKALVPGSVRYATGPASYQAEGGVLPANSIAWNKSAEALTARYADKRGDETLTLLLYPTPQIAESGLKSVQAQLAGLGPSFATAQSRREMELVMVANGNFPADQAQKMLENIHMRQIASVDKAIVINSGNVEIKKTASLLVNIAVLSGVLMLAAVLLGFFLGGGRALFRKMRGKDAATEAEFLSLHLAPQNAPAKFDTGKP